MPASPLLTHLLSRVVHHGDPRIHVLHVPVLCAVGSVAVALVLDEHEAHCSHHEDHAWYCDPHGHCDAVIDDGFGGSDEPAGR